MSITNGLTHEHTHVTPSVYAIEVLQDHHHENQAI